MFYIYKFIVIRVVNNLIEVFKKISLMEINEKPNDRKAHGYYDAIVRNYGIFNTLEINNNNYNSSQNSFS